jgi:surface protein
VEEVYGTFYNSSGAVDSTDMLISMDMEGITKSNTIAKIIKTNVAPSEDASTTPQCAMEQIEDGDDSAPRPFNYAEFYEDHPKLKLDLGEESTDEDDGPPLPFTSGQQRDSLRDAKWMEVTSQTTSSVASPIENNESIGDEENILHRVIRPENSPASDNETARRVVSTEPAAAERYPSAPIPVAHLVKEEVEDPPTVVVATPPPDIPVVIPCGHDTVYEATPLEPELPWWKQRRTKVIVVINCVLIAAIALAVGLGVPFSLLSYNNTGPNMTATAPNAETGDSSSSSQSPVKPSFRCFADRNELKAAVDRYVKDVCSAVATLCRDLSDEYGWPIKYWCVGKVTDMSDLFKDLSTFNEDISGWEVGKVTNMRSMFYGASAFDGNISSWDTSAVTDMSKMFYGASSFNKGLSQWNTSAVTTMKSMFYGASSFNQNLCAWKDNFPFSNAADIFVDSGCTFQDSPQEQGPFCASDCIDSTTMIATTQNPTSSQSPSYRCFADRNELKAAVNRYVTEGCGDAACACPDVAEEYGWPIGYWCVGKVTDMSELFKDLSTFNEDISGWEVGKVTNMKSMFQRASAFNGNISSWDTTAVTDVSNMFEDASLFNQDLSAWSTSAVTTMYAMFYESSAFNGNISSWDTTAVTDMGFMFASSSSFNQDLSAWNTSAVTTMYAMFYEASAFNGNISSWDTSAVTEMDNMFYGASKFNQDLSAWNTSAVTTMSAMFYEASAFNGNISSWDTSAVTDMEDMFYGASSFNQGLCP